MSYVYDKIWRASILGPKLSYMLSGGNDTLSTYGRNRFPPSRTKKVVIERDNLFFEQKKDLWSLICDYLVGDSTFWKCFMFDTLVAINSLYRNDETMQSYYDRTGVKCSSLWKEDASDFEFHENFPRQMPENYPDYFQLVLHNYFLKANSYDGEPDRPWVNIPIALIMEFLGYEYYTTTNLALIQNIEPNFTLKLPKI